MYFLTNIRLVGHWNILVDLRNTADVFGTDYQFKGFSEQQKTLVNET